MRLAIIGTFWLTQAFIEGIKEEKEIVYAGQYSRSLARAKEFAAAMGQPRCYDDMLALANDSEIDAVYIASPTAFHEQHIELFLSHGKHVLCEKPITLTLSAYERLLALADQKGVILVEAMMNAFVPEMTLLKEEIAALGGAHLARLDFSKRSGKLDAFLGGEVANSFSPEGGGALNDLGIYVVRLATSLFGRPIKTTAGAKLLENGADGWGKAVLHCPDACITLSYSKMEDSGVESKITCENGEIILPSVSQLIGLQRRVNGKKEAFGATYRTHSESMRYEAQAFYRMTKGDSALYERERTLTANALFAMDRIRLAIARRASE